MRNLADISKSDFGAKHFAFIDVKEYVENQGIEYTESGDWLKMKCILPFGHEDSSPSMFIHKLHGGWNCYVCGKGNWSQLCEHMEWEVEIESILVGGVHESVWNDSAKRIKDLANDTFEHDISHIPPSNLKKIVSNESDCLPHYKYLQSRDMVDLIKLFNICYVKKGDAKYGMNYVKRIIIPCHSKDGKYLWCEGRAITHQKVNRKYYRPFGVNKVKYLFNFHRVKKKRSNYIIVVEGIIDAMMLEMWDFPGVCCFGAKISDEQIQLLTQFNHIYVCLDNDKAGIEGWVDVKKKLSGLGVNINRILLPKGKDINDISKDKFSQLLKKSKIII